MMKTKGSATLWHRSPEESTRMDCWERIGLGEVHFFLKTLTGLCEGGVQTEDVLIVRIPTEGALQAAVGDRLCLGDSQAATPPGDCYTVTGVWDNRTGTPAVRHWKLLCK